MMIGLKHECPHVSVDAPVADEASVVRTNCCLAMGRPVVATDHGGAREQLSGGRMAWLTPPSDPVALAQAIDEALDLPVAERELLAPSAIANVRARFSKDTMCAHTLLVYRELVGI